MNRLFVRSLIVRYSILVALGVGNLWVIYTLFRPITVSISAGVLEIFYDNVVIVGRDLINYNGVYAYIVPACIAGSAYYLLLALNLSTEMQLNKRIKSLCFLLGLFLIINIIRISFFAILFSEGYEYFDLAHEMTWYFGSTILVVLLWFSNVYLFRIKRIPFYSDARRLLNSVKNSKKALKSKSKG